MVVYDRSNSAEIRNFFTFASRFASNRFIHSSQVPLSVTYRKVHNLFSNYTGSLQLASGGVCIVCEEKLASKDVDDLIYVIGEDKFWIKIDEQSSREQDLNVAIWIYQTESSIRNPKKSKSFISPALFPMVVRFYSTDDSKVTGPISTQDLETYLEWVYMTDCNLTLDAKNLLKNYYLTARRILGPLCTSQDLSALLIYAQSFAKLSLRNSGFIEDALLAIAVYEESCELKHGISVLPSTFPTLNILEKIFLSKSEVRLLVHTGHQQFI